ncbi:MAG: heavy-metal-associated domain-containing protein [Methylococcales bacterium]|nr:heavy-metal-associated domain-containing protein [Methylococcales bacterium]
MSESIGLTVTGMKCGGCETNVTGKLTALAGVISVKAAHKENSVSVEFDADTTTEAAIKQVITDAGFGVE